MRTLLYVRKPVGQYNILLPAYFRQVFGVGWDIFYGLLAIASLIFVTWFKIDENFYFLLINSYFDLVIIFDASMSLFIRFYQSVQVIFVNRNIEGAFIAAWNILGFALDFFSCLPYIILVIFTPRYYLVCSYQIVCILRLIRLYTPRRQFLDKSFYEKTISHYKRIEEEGLMLKDFGRFGTTLNPKKSWDISTKKKKMLTSKQKRK